jgi:hypothetical protein
MVVDADDLGGAGHHLTINFIDEDNATATLTLAGSDPVDYTLVRAFEGFGKGEKGDTGPEGPEGPQGPPGIVSTYQVENSVTIAQGSSESCTAECDPDDTALSGGWYTDVAGFYMMESGPTGNANEWIVTGYNTQDTDQLLTCYAICVVLQLAPQ